jgi:hypothetical protein
MIFKFLIVGEPLRTVANHCETRRAVAFAHERWQTTICHSQLFAVARHPSHMIKNFKKLKSLIKIRENFFFQIRRLFAVRFLKLRMARII